MRSENSGPGSVVWITLVSVSSILFSLALACATPFAAIAAIAGIWMSARNAFVLTFVAWLANQIVGYLLLGYPTTWDSFAWGFAIGLAAMLAVATVVLVRNALRSEWLSLAVGFLGAFIVYEVLLLAATLVLPSGQEAFSAAVVIQIFWTNLAALSGLVLLHRLALAAHLAPPPRKAVTGEL